LTRTIVLDAGPLGLVTNPTRSPEVLEVIDWLDDVVAAGWRLIVPAIADYEVRRELERAGKSRGLARLNAFNAADPERYLPLTDAALRLAASLWAQSRKRGTPTCDPRELDCDVLIAAQAALLAPLVDELVVATTNVGHLTQFVRAEHWSQILSVPSTEA
jgi:predicted nucleic acid-binding protein